MNTEPGSTPAAGQPPASAAQPPPVSPAKPVVPAHGHAPIPKSGGHGGGHSAFFGKVQPRSGFNRGFTAPAAREHARGRHSG